MKNKILINIIAFLFLFISCNDSFYSDNINLDGIWNKNNSADFDVEIKNNNDLYNIYLVIRNDNSYKYSNIWLLNQVKFKNKQQFKDTLEYSLADKKTGKWLGSGVFNNQIKLLYKEKVKFPEKGSYKFKIKHGMRDSNLLGIQDLGLIIEKQSE